ncbi:MAG: GAF domain-containing SpoIIE family protein phosphatase [Brevinematia bacterium]
MEKVRNDLKKILEINKKINSFSDLKDILENILLYARELFNALGGSLLLVDDEGKYLKFEVVHGEGKDKLTGIKIPLDKGIAGYVFSNQKPVISNNTDTDPRFFADVDKITGFKTQKILAVPLVKGNIPIGVIEVVNKVDNSDFNDYELELLSIFAEQAVIAINNALLLKKLKDRANELSYLYDISNFTISSIPNRKNLFQKIVDLIGEITKARKISIMFLDQKTGKLKVESCFGMDPQIASKVEVSIDDLSKPSSLCFNEGYYIFVKNVDRDPRFRPNKKLRYRTNSFAIFPIKSQGNTVGVLNLTEFDEGKKIEEEDIELLQVVSNQIGLAFESVRMYESDLERKALDSEIEIMNKIQNDMLTKNFNISNDLDINFAVLPYKMVGGDFYDVYKTDEGEVIFFLGDVSGKGLHASLFMAAAKYTVKAISFEFRDPKRILGISNNVLYQSTETGMFSTLFLGIINLKKLIILFSNAGHGQQFILRGNEVIHLNSKGIPLGIFEDYIYETKELKLNRGDIIVVYSDGITESVNINEEMFGEDRLIDLVRKYKNLPSKEIVRNVIESVMKFKVENPGYDDDISIGVIKVL